MLSAWQYEDCTRHRAQMLMRASVKNLLTRLLRALVPIVEEDGEIFAIGFRIVVEISDARLGPEVEHRGEVVRVD